MEETEAMHPFEIPAAIRERVMARRGRMHAFERIEPKTTALVVVDMQRVFLEPGAPSEVTMARAVVPNVNRLARALRAGGGVVAFSQATFPPAPAGGWSTFFDDMVSPELAERILGGLREDAPGRALWPDLEVANQDVVFSKCRYSAFARGSSTLEEILRARGTDTIVVAGTMTNLCCDSTARDAMQLDYKTIMISDACAARTDEEHGAALLTFMVSFGDVRTTDEMIALIESAAVP